MIKTMQDRQPGVTATAISGTLTLTKTGTTARTATFPDAAIVVAASNIGQTFTGVQVFGQPTTSAGGSVQMTSNTPGFGLEETDAGANAKVWDFFTSGGTLTCRLGNDARDTFTNWLTVSRSGTTPGTATFATALSATSLTATGLTSGRVPYVTTGGLLTDSVGLLYAVSTTHQLSIGNGSLGATAAIDGAAATARDVRMLTGGSNRWLIRCSATAESGSSAGSDFQLLARDDSGAAIDTTFQIVRAAGGAITLARPVTCTGAVTVPNGTAAAPGIRTTTYAHGLYSAGSTFLGLSVAGVASAIVTAPNGSVGGTISLNSPSVAEAGLICNADRNTGSNIFSGSTSSAAGGQVRVYGNTHATLGSYVEFTRGATVSAYFDGSGILTTNNTTDATTTSDGSVRLSGGLSVAASKSIVQGTSTAYHYFGPSGTDGSVRISGDAAGAIIFEKRASGSWTEIGRFS